MGNANHTAPRSRAESLESEIAIVLNNLDGIMASTADFKADEAALEAILTKAKELAAFVEARNLID